LQSTEKSVLSERFIPFGNLTFTDIQPPIAFISDRGGKYEIWKVRPDGTGLAQMTHEPGKEVIAPVWSPDGRKLLYQIRNVNSFVIDATRPGTEQEPQMLTGQPPDGFIPWEWSPDGNYLLGWQPPRPLHRERGIVVYSFCHQTLRPVRQLGRLSSLAERQPSHIT
jgi:hypothetical protein